MYNDGNSSKNVTGASVVDGTVEAVDLATAVNNDIADGVAGKATADLALPKAGGTMTGTIAGFTSTGIDDNATSTAITIDASENVGIGVTPEAWKSGYRALQLGTSTSLVDESGVAAVVCNAYKDAAGWKYQSTNTSTNYEGGLVGGHVFSVAPSGTADTAITWTTPLTIANTGDVTVGTGNLVIGTSGKGIDFSADGNAAGMTSEVLDDYETGTWTPTPTNSTFASAVGEYTKIGDLVYASFSVTLGTHNANYFQINGLPFSGTALVNMAVGSVSRTDMNTNDFTVMTGHGTSILLRNLANTDYLRYNAYNGKFLNGAVVYKA